MIRLPNMKNANKVASLDATKFYFRELNASTSTSVFDMFVKPVGEIPPSIVRSVNFINLENTEYEKNGARFTYYGSGVPRQDEAVELDNGKYLYCIVHGTQFVGTFDSHDDINMKYYEVTPLGNNVPLA